MPETGKPSLTAEDRRRFFEELGREYVALREDPVAWEEELAERRLLEATLMDGLDPDEIWTEDDFIVTSSDAEERGSK